MWLASVSPQLFLTSLWLYHLFLAVCVIKSASKSRTSLLDVLAPGVDFIRAQIALQRTVLVVCEDGRPRTALPRRTAGQHCRQLMMRSRGAPLLLHFHSASIAHLLLNCLLLFSVCSVLCVMHLRCCSGVRCRCDSVCGPLLVLALCCHRQEFASVDVDECQMPSAAAFPFAIAAQTTQRILPQLQRNVKRCSDSLQRPSIWCHLTSDHRGWLQADRWLRWRTVV